jgi:hypothetical protein
MLRGMSSGAANRARALDTAKTVVLLGALAGIGALVGYLALGTQGLGLALAAVIVLSFAGFRVPPEWVLRMQGGHEVKPWQAPDLVGMARSLAGRAGIPEPRLFLIPSPTPNALAVGGGHSPGALAVTSGALAVLSHDELEGVLAHEVAHLKNNDTEILRLAVLISEAVITLVRVSAWMALFITLFVGSARPLAGCDLPHAGVCRRHHGGNPHRPPAGPRDRAGEDLPLRIAPDALVPGRTARDGVFAQPPLYPRARRTPPRHGRARGPQVATTADRARPDTASAPCLSRRDLTYMASMMALSVALGRICAAVFAGSGR